MELRQIDLIFWDAQNRLDMGRQFRSGEPSGMLVAIARAAHYGAHGRQHRALGAAAGTDRLCPGLRAR
jgi:hypothetical protein